MKNLDAFELLQIEEERKENFDMIMQDYYFEFHNTQKNSRNFSTLRRAKERISLYRELKKESAENIANITRDIIKASSFPAEVLALLLKKVLSEIENAEHVYTIREFYGLLELNFKQIYFGEDDMPILTIYSNVAGRVNFYCLNEKTRTICPNFLAERFHGYTLNFIKYVINARINSGLPFCETDNYDFLMPVAEEFIKKVLIADGRIPKEELENKEGVKRN